jgi:hypothetical protein
MLNLKKFRKWMELATTAERKILAARAGTSHIYLYHIATGIRECSAMLAGEIEKASVKMHKASKKRLPKLLRSDLSKACAACPYSKKCRS